MTNGAEKKIEIPRGMELVKREVKSGGKVVGTVQVLCFKEDAEGLAIAKAGLTLKHVKDLNRQTVTDYMNSERVVREITPITQARRVRKVLSKDKQAEFDKRVAALAAEYEDK